ncbi:MAG: DUF1501 domain-containing protein [Planctomycetota bacterium]
MQFHRRDFVKLGLAGAAIGGLSPVFRSPLFQRTLDAATFGGGSSAKKMLVIFLRGGNDGVNTVIPYGDPEYNVSNRPNIFIPDTSSIDLGNGFAALHPALSEFATVYAAGDVAILHRVGYDELNRSHFEGQHYWENGIPGDSETEQGWIHRQVLESYDLAANPLAAASISDRLMVLFKGPEALPHIADLATYGLDVAGASQEKLLGTLPSGGTGSGLLGWYGRSLESGHGYDSLLGSTGLAMGETLQALEDAGIDPSTYVPENGAVYPDAGNPQGFANASLDFFSQIRDAAMLLKQTDLRVAGVEISGFDTHAGQGGENGAHANLLSTIGLAVRSLSQDLQSIWNDTLVVTLSEFGRTSEQNGSNGTDHGEASCMFVAGGSVNGGVYNCDATTWAPGDMFSTPNARYVSQRTDYRAVIGEILDRHFGLTAPQRDIVIPGLSSQIGVPEFDPLSFLP